jgi:quercetin dioxygenase-like cupin family protein
VDTRPEIRSGNIFIRRNPLPKVGDKVDGHTHNFDHTTIVFLGSVRVRATRPDGKIREQVFEAPSHFLVYRDVEHEITALEDNTLFWCVYSHRDPQGRVVQEWDGWNEAYQ